MKQEILRFENVTRQVDGAVYLDNFNFSRIELIDQLEYDGFSRDEASSAASELGL